jgi:hypothetical protein
MLIHEVPLDDVKIGTWCAMSAARIIELIFLSSEAINLQINHTHSVFGSSPLPQGMLAENLIILSVNICVLH